MIGGDSYALIHVPGSQATVEERHLRCRDPVTRRRKDCEIYEEGDSFTVVKVEDLCTGDRSSLCDVDDLLTLTVQLSNSNSLRANFEPESFKI